MSTQPRSQNTSSRPTAQTEIEAGPSTTSPEQPPNGVLKLRGAPLKKQRVVWSEETVDNEGMGKKKSKICCIYHKPKAFDESSDESSCSSSDEGNHSARKSKSNKHKHTHGQSSKRRSRDGGNGDIEQQPSSDSSSESDGGAGDGRARPARKPRKHIHSHDCDHHGQGRVNKYDVQPKSSTGASGAQNQNGSS